jgi:hypothetical protein
VSKRGRPNPPKSARARVVDLGPKDQSRCPPSSCPIVTQASRHKLFERIRHSPLNLHFPYGAEEESGKTPTRLVATAWERGTLTCCWACRSSKTNPRRSVTVPEATGRAVVLRVSPDGVKSVDPAAVVVSFLEPNRPFDSDVINSFCHYVHFFADAGAGERWTAEHPWTFLMALEEAFELGRLTDETVVWR